MAKFICKGDKFLLDGKPFTVYSGSIHYFRIPSFYWKDRLLKLKECGFNTVETYDAWNIHEKTEGIFDFSGEADLGEFIDLAAELGLKVIVRGGPYICAEWEGGGLPAWLLSYPDMQLRTCNELYLSKVERYLENLFAVVKPRLISNGGNVIMMQVENEYGTFGNDKKYLEKIRSIYDKNGMDCQLFTCDGVEKNFLAVSKLDGIPAFANFGSDTVNNMQALKALAPNQPLMCTEFWCGWFDHWHHHHHVRSAESICKDTEPFIQNGWGFNFYMFCGGTNFGFMNGANYPNTTYQYLPTVTSYDYNALLTEAGDRTAAYYGVRALFEKYGYKLPELSATETEKRAYGKVQFTACAELFNTLSAFGKSVYNATPLSMEKLGQAYGYVLYSTTVGEEVDGYELNIDGLADRANIFLNGKSLGVYERGQEYEKVKMSVKEPSKLDILIENMGRINYGQYTLDSKGMTSARGVLEWRNCKLFHWDMYSLPMEDFSKVSFKEIPEKLSQTPTFYKGKFDVDKRADTFLKVDGFQKGFVLVNGVNIGRYYTSAGPQKTLFVPACYLQEGENELLIFDSDGTARLDAEFLATPELG